MRDEDRFETMIPALGWIENFIYTSLSHHSNFLWPWSPSLGAPPIRKNHDAGNNALEES
jgi:hypothetical protein